MNPSSIQQRASALSATIWDWRCHLHRNPELSFQEYKTAAFVEEKLAELGIKGATRVAETGVTALIEGRNPGSRTLALRADLDALPIQETNKTAWASQHAGIMHACGHDVHTSSLLGAAAILQETKSEWEGTVKLVFQPGEEVSPGGASLLIEAGILEKPHVHEMYGQHVMPLLPVGTVGFREGLYMASTDEIFVTVKGKGGHGAMPHLNCDPVSITAQLIVGLQQVVSRKANPITPSVLSFGKVMAQGATNVIPDQVYLEGTFRTLDEAWRKQAHQWMTDMAKGICESMGAEVDFRIVKGYPFLVNDPTVTRKAKTRAVSYLGAENVVDLDIWMAAEDFAFYSQQVPACFYRLGTRNEAKHLTSSVHTSTFDVDQEALTIGAGLMAWMVISNE